MGLALAEAAADCGASVSLVLGPVNLKPQITLNTLTFVETAAEMAEATKNLFPDSDVAILAAAVADYTSSQPAGTKIKRKGDEVTVRLKPTEDIAAALGHSKTRGQIVAGFALETDNETQNAIEKLHRKKLDLIILNSLRDKGAGFGTDTNRITIIDKYNKTDIFELKSKEEVALDILEKISAMVIKERESGKTNTI
jgi:phosphopantothenoylcysteine decarboxylase / phosphopantothenate---cysteine ligase